jgi:NhaA family Na+:H+ antiporter
LRPREIRWAQVIGAGFLCGIGFTMSFFIAGVAFTEPGALSIVKLSVLGASIVAGATGWLILTGSHRRLVRQRTRLTL